MFPGEDEVGVHTYAKTADTKSSPPAEMTKTRSKSQEKKAIYNRIRKKKKPHKGKKKSPKRDGQQRMAEHVSAGEGVG